VHYVGSAKYPLNGTFQAFEPLLTGPIPDSRVGNYVLLNLRGAYRFQLESIGGRNAEVAVTAFNALNDKHREHPLGEKIGSLVMGWFTINY
jgi:iron complex outermembrane receptor protein